MSPSSHVFSIQKIRGYYVKCCCLCRYAYFLLKLLVKVCWVNYCEITSKSSFNLNTDHQSLCSLIHWSNSTISNTPPYVDNGHTCAIKSLVCCCVCSAFAVCGWGIIFSLHMKEQSLFSLSWYDLSLIYYFQWPSCAWSQVLTMPLNPRTQVLSLFVQLKGWLSAYQMHSLFWQQFLDFCEQRVPHNILILVVVHLWNSMFCISLLHLVLVHMLASFLELMLHEQVLCIVESEAL